MGQSCQSCNGGPLRIPEPSPLKPSVPQRPRQPWGCDALYLWTGFLKGEETRVTISFDECNAMQCFKIFKSSTEASLSLGMPRDAFM